MMKNIFLKSWSNFWQSITLTHKYYYLQKPKQISSVQVCDATTAHTCTTVGKKTNLI